MRTAVGVLSTILALSVGCASQTANERAEVDVSEEEEVETAEARRARERRKRSVLPPQHVKFTVKNADLKDEVLPLFLKQAGVRIVWSGSARTVKRLRFTEPVHWRDALALVCQFTNTHLTRDYQGRQILKHGWSGRLESSPSDRGRGGASGGGPQASRGSGARPARSSGGGSGGSRRAGATTWDNTYGGPSASSSNAGDTAKRVLKGTTTRRSGGR